MARAAEGATKVCFPAPPLIAAHTMLEQRIFIHCSENLVHTPFTPLARVNMPPLGRRQG